MACLTEHLKMPKGILDVPVVGVLRYILHAFYSTVVFLCQLESCWLILCYALL